MSAHENPQSQPQQFWTYRMEVSPTGQPVVQPAHHDSNTLLHALVNLQYQVLETQKQILLFQQQQSEFLREMVQVSREQRARHVADLEKWQNSHEHVLGACRESIGKLEQVHAALLGEITNYVEENHENLLDGDYSLTDFVDRYGPRLAHVNTMLAVLRPLTTSLKKPEPPSPTP